MDSVILGIYDIMLFYAMLFMSIIKTLMILII